MLLIGVSGLEAVYEDELRGRDGVETITRSSDGVIVGTAMTTVPEPGHTVQLTVNSDFQKAVEQALCKNIDMISRAYGTDVARVAVAGALGVVILEVVVHAVAVYRGIPVDDAGVQRGNGHRGLIGRARGVQALQRPVEQRWSRRWAKTLI